MLPENETEFVGEAGTDGLGALVVVDWAVVEEGETGELGGLVVVDWDVVDVVDVVVTGGAAELLFSKSSRRTAYSTGLAKAHAAAQMGRSMAARIVRGLVGERR